MSRQLSRQLSSSGDMPPRSWGAAAVRVSYGAAVALDEVSVTAAPGSITAVVGGDGAGKTTLLRCLAGALAPDSGTVSTPGAIATGYFPASTGTYPDLTVAQNLAFRAAAYGMPQAPAGQRAAELMEFAGLATVRDRLAGQLSGGMRQKLGVIAAMMHRPALLILDEPTTGVDPVSRSGLWWLITRAVAGGAAVVLSTTYLDDAQRAAAVLVLDSGRELAFGSPEEIVSGLKGSVLAAGTEPSGALALRAWRRGNSWRVWIPPGAVEANEVAGEPVTPDLQDAVTVAALARESGARQPVTVPVVAPPATAAAGPLAECHGVSCRFGHFTAVHEVSLQVRAGEVVGLLGANGAGKTTLIRMLLGLQRATSGAVMLLGEPPSRRTRSRIGYVPQGLGLYDDLTAAENMQFAAAAFGTKPGVLPPDIAALAGVPVGELPLGLQRRTAFAEALSHAPDLLILDEPSSGVDPLGRARLWDTISRAARRGAGVLVTTHYMEEAAECDRLIIMAGGVIVAAGTMTEIIAGSQVTVVQTDAWAAAFARLAAAGIPAALAGRTLRVPGVPAAAVEAALSGGSADGAGVTRLSEAPASLEERFFELVASGGTAAAATT